MSGTVLSTFIPATTFSSHEDTLELLVQSNGLRLRLILKSRHFIQINTQIQYISTHPDYTATWTTKLQVQMCHLSAPGFSMQTVPVTTPLLTSLQNAQTVNPAMQKIDTEFVTGFFNSIFYHDNMVRSLGSGFGRRKYFSSTGVRGPTYSVHINYIKEGQWLKSGNVV